MHLGNLPVYFMDNIFNLFGHVVFRTCISVTYTPFWKLRVCKYDDSAIYYVHTEKQNFTKMPTNILLIF